MKKEDQLSEKGIMFVCRHCGVTSIDSKSWVFTNNSIECPGCNSKVVID